ncbi:MAG: c-type cytochrome [Bryobacterales bacterium]|nr:c-type cytochrome [Bryobacterales bacterium]
MRRAIRILLLIGAAAAAHAAPGLVATYSDGVTTLREVVPSPSFYLEPGETLHPALKASFGAVFEGKIAIERSGEHRFFLGRADLEIDGRPVRGPLTLAAGEHAVLLRFSSARDEHGLRLEWQGPGFAREPVPARVFHHPNSDAPRPIDRLAERGRRLAEDLGCANCHLAAPSLAKRPGPPLDGIGSRTSGAWLKRWLDDPQSFRSTAVMPRAAHRSDANDLAEYLMSLTAPAAPAPAGDPSAGAALFESIGCIACHARGGVSLAGLGSKTTAAHLTHYLRNPFVWEPSGRMPSLDLTEQQAADLAAHLALSRDPDFERQPLGGDAGLGRQRFESSGCVACHQLDGASNRLTSPPMDALDPTRGCLANAPSAPAPIFALQPSERDALRAFVALYKATPDISPAPIHAFRARLEQLRCNACHFDPARAPSLDGVGDKLQTAWLRRVLSEPVRVYDGLDMRMPHFLPEHAAALAEGFAKTAGLAPGPGELPPPMTPGEMSNGRAMLGVDPQQGGMGCVRCHGWGERPSLGRQAPNLAPTASRLRYDWFLRWMRDPARIHPGTAMPAYFDGQAPEQSRAPLETLWAGLAAPASAGLPPGLDQAPSAFTSIPSDGAVVVRQDSPETLLVRLAGGVSYTFDIAQARLAFASRNAEPFYRQTEFPIRPDDPDRIPAARFIGLTEVEGVPELHYEAAGVELFERIFVRGTQLVRRFRVPDANRPLWLVLSGDSGADVTTSLGSGLTRFQLPRGNDVAFEVRIALP